ncbi:MAG: peptidoglycan DD-metalloendopeptidase family protein [Anaerolineales bacterium]
MAKRTVRNLNLPRPQFYMRVFLIPLLLIILLISACAGTPNSPISAPPAVQEIAPETPEFSPAYPLPILPDTGAAANIADSDDGPPARFTFPTQAPPPKSAWRPPLYPVPWALRDFDHFFFIRPIPVEEINWPLANYRYGGIFFEDVVHTGVDIPGPRGTPVLAAGSGKVVWSGYGLLNFSPGNLDDPYGLAIAIKHDFGYQDQTLYTLYAHLSESYVIENQVVEAGDVIGLTGQTGVTTGPHLHFEVRIGQNSYFSTRNPELWIAPPQGWGLLAGRVMTENGNLLERKEITVTSIDTYQVWLVMTYGAKNVNSDPYYQENVVMGDLPAGKYQLDINYGDEKYSKVIEIVPGAVSYFTFRGQDGFTLDLPPTPTADPDLVSP